MQFFLKRTRNNEVTSSIRTSKFSVFFFIGNNMYILIEKKFNRRMRNPPTRDETKQHKKITRHYTKITTNSLP